MKFMLFVLPTVPATLEERERLRPIGRNNDRYQMMLDELRRLAVFADDAGFDVMTRLLSVAIIPRLIRLRDAPRYLGMDKNRFNRDVRPRVTAIRIGTQGIAFDRIDLDAWAAINADPSVREFLGGVQTREQAAGTLARFRADLESRG